MYGGQPFRSNRQPAEARTRKGEGGSGGETSRTLFPKYTDSHESPEGDAKVPASNRPRSFFCFPIQPEPREAGR